jgi:arginine and glutamate-rich protein 1
MLEENRSKVEEEAQRKGALEQQQKELERYLELERIQKQSEEALRQKKIEEEERANQLRLLGKDRY